MARTKSGRHILGGGSLAKCTWRAERPQVQVSQLPIRQLWDLSTWGFLPEPWICTCFPRWAVLSAIADNRLRGWKHAQIHGSHFCVKVANNAHTGMDSSQLRWRIHDCVCIICRLAHPSTPPHSPISDRGGGGWMVQAHLYATENEIISLTRVIMGGVIVRSEATNYHNRLIITQVGDIIDMLAACTRHVHLCTQGCTHLWVCPCAHRGACR